MTFFQFEADFVDTLRCIPMQVRLKLDTCGVKLKLSHWHQLNDYERRTLVEMPCNTTQESQGYSEYLQGLVVEKTGKKAAELKIDPHPPWGNEQEIPPTTENKAAECGVTINIEQWKNLTLLQRFALIKLSRPSHENKNFYPALKEFGLIR